MDEVIHLLEARDSDAKSEAGPPAIRAVVVLFLSDGRNAWHSTWSVGYRPGDFLRDGRKVGAIVERRKTRGTVFYLDVLPAFQLSYGNRKFLLTEINTREPFRNIVVDNVRYGLMSADLSGFLTQIVPPSSLWTKSQRQKNSVILQEVKDDFIDMTTYTMLAKGRDGAHNPPLGSYKRLITGTFYGDSSWEWTPLAGESRPKSVSLRWYNQTLEALAEGSERIADHRGQG